LSHDAANSTIRYYLGEAYLRLQRTDDALREWKAVLAQDPSFAPASDAIQKLQLAKR
jgi:cytochrome c-type biogenesis protein CcmH/NrfG